MSTYALDGLDEHFAEATIEHNANTPAADVRRGYQRGVRCGTVSEVLEPIDVARRAPAFAPRSVRVSRDLR